MSIGNPRIAACHDLTRLIQEHRPFSFLRLGDGEVAFMLAVQDKRAPYRPELRASCEMAYDGPGIEERHYDRLRRAYEECTYLDYHDNIPINIENLPRLELARKPGLYRNETPATATLIFDWTYHEFGKFIAGRKCLFAGAEGSLLRELYADPEYRDLAKDFWPADAQPFFHQVRGDGHALSANLDLIKADLATLITEHQIDTLFLCLGGAAKIICHELSQELNIRAIDWGSMMRGLAYCGSAGFATWRASHSPYFVRVPFAMHMDALERAYPQFTPATLVAKAHSQLCLELQRKEVARSFPADALDDTNYDAQPENLRRFEEARRIYERRYCPLAKTDPEAGALIAEFRFWRLKKGIGWDGRLFLIAVAIKGVLRRLFPWLFKCRS